MKKMNKRSIEKALKIIDRLGTAADVSIYAITECEAEAIVANNESSRSFSVGSYWGMINTYCDLKLITVDEMFLLEDYRNYLVDKKVKELRAA